MTRILSTLETRHLDNDRFTETTAPFGIESDVLKKAGFDPAAWVPTKFVQDGESVPVVRGRNIRGGVTHDYFSCYDSVPVVTKAVAAAIYFEINEYCDLIDSGRNKLVMAKDWVRRWSKWAVVYVWPGYFHKRSVSATSKEICGLDGDPYVSR